MPLNRLPAPDFRKPDRLFVHRARSRFFPKRRYNLLTHSAIRPIALVHVRLLFALLLLGFEALSNMLHANGFRLAPFSLARTQPPRGYLDSPINSRVARRSSQRIRFGLPIVFNAEFRLARLKEIEPLVEHSTIEPLESIDAVSNAAGG